MNTVNFTLNSTNETHRLAMKLPPSIRQTLSEQEEGVFVTIGKKTERVHLMEGDSLTVEVNEAFVHTFCLPCPLTLQWHYDKDNHTVIFGPFLAIWTECVGNVDSPSFAGMEPFLEECTSFGADHGVGVFVLPTSLPPSSEWQGFYWTETGIQTAKFPSPHVVYNRIHRRSYEASPQFALWTERFTEEGILSFNPSFFSKTVVQSHLETQSDTRYLLPATVAWDKKAVLNWVRSHKSFFLKPENGSQGKGIVVCSSTTEGLRIERTHPAKVKILSLENTNEEIWTELSSYIKGNALVQETISFRTVQASPVDFRYILHRRNNEWRMTSSVARIGQPGGTVSNVARGGTMARTKSVLDLWYDPRTAKDMEKQLAKTVRKLAAPFSEWECYELGLDVGIDEDNRIWLIEVNSKPSKKWTHAEKAIRPSTKQLIFQTLDAFLE